MLWPRKPWRYVQDRLLRPLAPRQPPAKELRELILRLAAHQPWVPVERRALLRQPGGIPLGRSQDLQKGSEALVLDEVAEDELVHLN